MRKTINLTRVNGCYSKELREFTPTILYAAQEPLVSLDDMKKLVYGIVDRASINATAKKRFIEKLFECQTKEAVRVHCYEAVIHGMYYHPKHAANST